MKNQKFIDESIINRIVDFRKEYIWIVRWKENGKDYTYQKRDNIYAQNIVWNKFKKECNPKAIFARITCIDIQSGHSIKSIIQYLKK